MMYMLLIFLCVLATLPFFSFFFFNDTATTEIYTLSLHDALPISARCFTIQPTRPSSSSAACWADSLGVRVVPACASRRSEEHTSELQSQSNLVCRLLLEKKKNNYIITLYTILTYIT